MGTRFDFYVGRGEGAEWLGSGAWDGYPEGIFGMGDDHLPVEFKDEAHWRLAVHAFLTARDDATLPEQGWPWPWDDSGTTDYAYAYDEGAVYSSGYGRPWFLITEGEPRDDEGDRIERVGPKVVFPDMSAVKNFTMGTRSGILLIGPQGPIDGAQIDAEESAKTADG